jgi:hypothetical protein
MKRPPLKGPSTTAYVMTVLAAVVPALMLVVQVNSALAPLVFALIALLVLVPFIRKQP